VTSQTALRDAWVPRIKIDPHQSPHLGVPGHGGRHGAGGAPHAGHAGPELARAPLAATAVPATARPPR
jgi:hypothetical protein